MRRTNMNLLVSLLHRQAEPSLARQGSVESLKDCNGQGPTPRNRAHLPCTLVYPGLCPRGPQSQLLPSFFGRHVLQDSSSRQRQAKATAPRGRHPKCIKSTFLILAAPQHNLIRQYFKCTYSDALSLTLSDVFRSDNEQQQLLTYSE